MGRLTKSENDLIRNKAIAIIRNLTADEENKLTHDELSVLSSFLLIERAENTKLKKCEDEEKQPTAFNVEAVVEEVKGVAGTVCFYVNCHKNCDCCDIENMFRELIDVIRKGGVKND